MKQLELIKIVDIYENNKKNIPILVGVLLVILFGLLTFLALYPFENDDIAAVSQARIEELDVKFNTKILNELETKLNPTEITGVGGRDPFARF